jgi:prepilin-type processing-associated H-X9-DG protein
LTRIELLVVIIIVVLLTAVCMPCLERAGEAGRRMTCMNNLRNLSLAVLNYASSNKGTLPLLASNLPGTELQVNWAVTLMPLLDNVTAFDRVASQPTSNQAQTLSQILNQRYKVYTCPSKFTSYVHDGGLSYAVNIGYGNFRVSAGRPVTIDVAPSSLNAQGLHAADNYSWSGERTATEEDKTLSRATGVFWLADTDGYRAKLDDINNGDGTGQTILMTENLNSGSLNTYVEGKIGGLVDPRAFGFGLGIADLGLSKNLEPGTLRPNFQKYWKINSNRGTSVGQFPVPSSLHGGVVNVAFCDGSARTVADTIDPRIYSLLLTPQGVRYGEYPISDCGF